jgi:hypothetical protein
VLQSVEEQDRQLDPEFLSRLPLPPMPKEEKRFFTWGLVQNGQTTAAIPEMAASVSNFCRQF